jgi:phospholipid/cholesterol/gamma-HCH transport system permease protein
MEYRAGMRGPVVVLRLRDGDDCPSPYDFTPERHMATAGASRAGLIVSLGDFVYLSVAVLGDFFLFALRTLGWLLRKRPAPYTLVPNFYLVGVRSVPVIALTGTFIGMVLAVQTYHQFKRIGVETRLGAMIDVTIFRELGPVLAATMLAGRVGSSIAAELGTMKVTEQVDALACLGAHPIHYLVVPRLLACTLLIPLLTIMADFMGITGGAVMCTHVFGVEAHAYWQFAQDYVRTWDIFMGLIKATFFGAAIGLISCYCGLNSRPGAEGVGRAATESFVASFVVILILDLFLSLVLLRFFEGSVRSFLG